MSASFRKVLDITNLGPSDQKLINDFYCSSNLRIVNYIANYFSDYNNNMYYTIFVINIWPTSTFHE